MQTILIKDGTIVTMDDSNSIVRGDLLVRDGRIDAVGAQIDETVNQVIEARGCAVLSRHTFICARRCSAEPQTTCRSSIG